MPLLEIFKGYLNIISDSSTVRYVTMSEWLQSHILTPTILVDIGIRTRDLLVTKHSGYLLVSHVKR